RSLNTFGGLPHYNSGATVTVYLPPMPFGEIKASLNTYYTSERFNNEQQYTAAGAFRPTTQLAAFRLWDTRIEVNQFLGHENLSLGFTGKNLTKAKYYNGGNELQAAFGVISGQLGAARQFLVDLRYDF